MQQEVNDLKSEKETYEQELERLFRNNEEFIPKDGKNCWSCFMPVTSFL
jgi:hypothetical protein